MFRERTRRQKLAELRDRDPRRLLPISNRMGLFVAAMALTGAFAPLPTLLARGWQPESRDTQTFSGVVTDDMCSTGDHSQMRMGSTDVECATACVNAHGAAYVLSAGKEVYTLRTAQALESFAGKKVKVAGVLDKETRTIRVSSIALAD